jgi:DNA-binding response OmpR family regulator
MKSKKIAFVDDNPNDLTLYGAMLKNMNYEVLLINNPYIAIDKINEFKPDIVFMDVRLGTNISGFHLVNKLRIDNFKGAVYMLSASDDFTNINNSLDSGADDYLVKPIFSNILNNLIERYNGNSKRDIKPMFSNC